MKYVLLLGDGMADRPLDALGGKTPLEAAKTPTMDRIAKLGRLGLVKTIPDGFQPGSDVANMVIMGYDPAEHFSGRGPLEAASMGVKLKPDEVAFRCNLVQLDFDSDPPKMKDFTAGHISTEKARSVIEVLNDALGDDVLRFYPGVSYRHLMVWGSDVEKTEITPPHDITGRPIASYLPKGDGAEKLYGLMQRSMDFFKSPEFLDRWEADGKHDPPNAIWPWGQGKAPAMSPLTEKFGVSGAIITAVDLLKGLGIYAGLEIIDVPGATGYYDTDYEAKADYALKALDGGKDFVYVHVEAPDEAGHEGAITEKIRAIESFDQKVVARILDGLKKFDEWSVLVTPDHATPIEVMTHTSEPVPFAVLHGSIAEPTDAPEGFSEREAERTKFYIDDGKELIARFFKGNWE